jgi:hypothetical protein
MNEYITTPTVEGASSFFKSIDLQTDERTINVYTHYSTNNFTDLTADPESIQE